MKSTPGARLRYLRELLGFEGKQQEFADRIGLSQQSVSNMERDKTEPAAKSLNKIYAAFQQVNISWLVTGVGEPLDTMREGRTLTPTDTATPKDTEKQEAAEVPLTASRGGLPTPGEATPQQADFVGKLIQRLETELAGYQEREVWYQDMLKKPSPAPDATWLPAPAATPISLRPAACTPTNAQAGGKVIALWPATVVARATA
jgi:transcriptional regulator with XRE-family HTH domain